MPGLFAAAIQPNGMLAAAKKPCHKAGLFHKIYKMHHIQALPASYTAALSLCQSCQLILGFLHGSLVRNHNVQLLGHGVCHGSGPGAVDAVGLHMPCCILCELLTHGLGNEVIWDVRVHAALAIISI